MNVVESYTPGYVLRLQENTDPCGCPFCRSQPALVSLRWQNQVRHSAHPGCDRAAHAVLCHDDAFLLHQGETRSDAVVPLSEKLEKCNQGCINLLINSDADLNVRLYTLGIFISKARQLDDAAAIGALADQLESLLAEGEMAKAFAQLPPINKYKLAALRALSESELEADLDPLSGMMLVLKMNELKVMSDSYLEESLYELENSAELAAFMQSHSRLFVNYLLWECYHNVFPGEATDAWEKNFYRLCLTVFSMRMLCAIFLQNEIEPDDAVQSALFAAWQRAATEKNAGEPALLIGLSLLQPSS
ncbi:hypothetical protein [Erwinia oleae]|uniref:hypothetical protein n=1 Tax=Erwinia oleae TaxID=796334 RepID=UPI000554BE09|nr:hypothetical protein [Erwinia oleae]